MDPQRISVELNRFLPARALRGIRRAIAGLEKARSRGDAVFCNLCGGTFKAFRAFNGRPSARCPACRSLERHRLVWSVFEDQHLLDQPIRLLHIAPEPQLSKRLAAIPHVDYVSGDLMDKEVMMRIDVTRIDLQDASFDAVICSHVLEHVDDADAAMTELLRILTPGGWAILDTPVDWERENTYEDQSLTSHAERQAAFGQWDHVRIFGRDFPDLLRKAGWQVSLEQPFQGQEAEARQIGVKPGSLMILGRKPTLGAG